MTTQRTRTSFITASSLLGLERSLKLNDLRHPGYILDYYSIVQTNEGSWVAFYRRVEGTLEEELEVLKQGEE